MFIAVRPLLIRAHRWIGVALAPVFLLVIISGAVLSFRPILSDPAPRPDAVSTVNVPALTSLLERLEGVGPISAIAIVDGGKTVDVASSAAGLAGAWDVTSGAPAAMSGRGVDVFAIAERVHISLLLGLGFVVEAASWAMLAAILVGPFLAALRFRNSLMGWHRALGWVLLPVVLVAPLTAVLMTLGVGRGGAPLPVATHPVTISQALVRAAPAVDLSRLTSARTFRRGSVLMRIGGDNGGAFVVTDSATVMRSGGPGIVQQIHEGTWAGAWSGGLNFAISLALLALTTTGLWSWLGCMRSERGAPLASDAEILVAHASQTGTAESLAAATAQALVAGGEKAVATPIGSLAPEALRRFRNVLIIGATTGEGDLPDGAARFVARLTPESLTGVRFALIALGDRRYVHFCGGAETLRSALLEAGAEESAQMVRADGDPTAAWRAWLETLAADLGLRLADSGSACAPPVTLRLVDRARLDDPRRGDTRETWAVVLASDLDLAFRPGDLLRIAPLGGGRERPYSIGSSSLVDPRRIELTVRLHRRIRL